MNPQGVVKSKLTAFPRADPIGYIGLIGDDAPTMRTSGEHRKVIAN